MINLSLIQEVQSLLYEQSEEKLQAILAILQFMSDKPHQQTAENHGSIIGVLKDKYTLPSNFLEQSAALDKEIAQSFYG